MQPDKRLIASLEVYTAFKGISDRDPHLFRLSDEYARSEWMILIVMPVPPPHPHPSIAVDGGPLQTSVVVIRKELLPMLSRSSSNYFR